MRKSPGQCPRTWKHLAGGVRIGAFSQTERFNGSVNKTIEPIAEVRICGVEVYDSI